MAAPFKLLFFIIGLILFIVFNFLFVFLSSVTLVDLLLLSFKSELGLAGSPFLGVIPFFVPFYIGSFV